MIAGGTRMANRIAIESGIPVLNLGAIPPRAVCGRRLAIRRAGASP